MSPRRLGLLFAFICLPCFLAAQQCASAPPEPPNPKNPDYPECQTDFKCKNPDPAHPTAPVDPQPWQVEMKTGAGAKAGAPQTITLSRNTICLCRRKNGVDSVSWVTPQDPSLEFLITFKDRSPLSRHYLTNTDAKKQNKPIPEAPSETPFNYRVELPDGSCIDPGIIIH